MREATNSIVENDDMSDALMTVERGAITRAEVMGEICHHLAPFQIGEKPITGATVITKDLAIDSLAVMDMVMASTECVSSRWDSHAICGINRSASAATRPPAWLRVTMRPDPYVKR